MPVLKPLEQKYAVVGGLIIAIFLGLGLVLWLSLDEEAEKLPIAWFIIAAAFLGSVVNEPFRKREPLQSGYGWIIAYVVWKSGVSIVFAFLLYFLFIGGMISGDLFPRFVHTGNGGEQALRELMTDFVTNVKPETYKDIAKVLVWSFIAGYSEKFVPNLITQLLNASRAKEHK